MCVNTPDVYIAKVGLHKDSVQPGHIWDVKPGTEIDQFLNLSTQECKTQDPNWHLDNPAGLYN